MIAQMRIHPSAWGLPTSAWRPPTHDCPNITKPIVTFQQLQDLTTTLSQQKNVGMVSILPFGSSKHIWKDLQTAKTYSSITRFFKDSGIKNGTYIELGAFDGTQESNTRFFDKCLGWKGLLIEGNPINYQGVVESRPFSNKMSFAPSCDASYELENKTVEFYRYPMTNVGLVDHAKTYKGKPTVAVPCGPLSPVIEDIFQEGHVNFFSLDVEGSEAKVLATIDFTKVQIDVIMIEIENNFCQSKHCEVRNQVRAKMAKEGYKAYYGLVFKSDIYVHPNSAFQKS